MTTKRQTIALEMRVTDPYGYCQWVTSYAARNEPSAMCDMAVHADFLSGIGREIRFRFGTMHDAVYASTIDDLAALAAK